MSNKNCRREISAVTLKIAMAAVMGIALLFVGSGNAADALNVDNWLFGNQLGHGKASGECTLEKDRCCVLDSEPGQDPDCEGQCPCFTAQQIAGLKALVAASGGAVSVYSPNPDAEYCIADTGYFVNAGIAGSRESGYYCEIVVGNSEQCALHSLGIEGYPCFREKVDPIKPGQAANCRKIIGQNC